MVYKARVNGTRSVGRWACALALLAMIVAPALHLEHHENDHVHLGDGRTVKLGTRDAAPPTSPAPDHGGDSIAHLDCAILPAPPPILLPSLVDVGQAPSPIFVAASLVSRDAVPAQARGPPTV